MSYFTDALKKEIDLMKQIQINLAADPIRAKHVTLAVKHQYHQFYYYKVTKGKGSKSKRTYIGKLDSDALRKTVLSTYKQAMLDAVHHNLDVLKRTQDEYIQISEQRIRSLLSPCVRNVPVENNFIPDMEDLYRWAKGPYEKNPREYPEQVIIAKDGTRVRSRGECIIYNALLDAGVPFRYDPLLKFMRKNKYGEYEDYYESPDFQILLPDGSYVLLEHAGLLSSLQYAETLASKIQIYLQNGYMLGYTLFVTSDTYDGGIDSAELEKLIQFIKTKFPLL
ncbi:MAG: hypothetical protein IKF54_03120 [Eubacterium sp.]|nr:hypothetical protein [Eubacterium sp.]